jgi:tRNA-dihydrouridine synthase
MEFVGFTLRNNLFVAPMAGVTDRPFRQLCKKMGAGLAVSEMVTSNSLLYGSAKTLRRANHEGEVAPISVQIAGADPGMMAEAARHNVDNGAQIIDINMGCPAKKVCNVMAGSALMQDEQLVGKILDAVVSAVPNTPVTLKFRTGWNLTNRNAPTIARIAEAAGIRAVAIHGRTRCQQYTGEAEYDTIAMVKTLIRIPVIANGDIQARPRRDRRRRHHDRPRRPGPPLAVPRNRALPENRRASPAGRGQGDPQHPVGPSRRPLRVLRPGNGFQGRPQAYFLVHQGTGWFGCLPQGNERPAWHRPADAGG